MGKHTSNDDNGDVIEKKWKNAIISILEGESSGMKNKSKNISNDLDAAPQSLEEQEQQRLKVKKLRKLVFLSMQLDDDDDENGKAAKKSFKHTIQTLEMENKIHLDADGHITLIRKKNKKKNTAANEKRVNDADNESKQKKKKIKLEDENDDADMNRAARQQENTTGTENDTAQTDGTASESKKSNVPCVGNPQGITRLFIGNLSFQINETILEEFLPGLTHVKWITDKTTGKFYGSAFIEMLTSQHAADAVGKNGQSVSGRPIKINYAPALPGDHWPPERKVVTGGNTNIAAANGGEETATKGKPSATKSAGGMGIQSMSTKPENCCKLFIGNLSYEITDETITKFFNSIDVELKAVRWIHHKDSGDFKGVYVVYMAANYEKYTFDSSPLTPTFMSILACCLTECLITSEALWSFGIPRPVRKLQH